MCAMDLLASLAGKILEEGQSSSASSNAFEGNAQETKQEDHHKPVKSESSDQGNSVSMPAYENTSDKCVVNSFSFPDNDGILERTPMSDHKKIHGETGGNVNVNTGFEQGEAIDGMGDGGLTTNTCNLEDKTALVVQLPKPVCVDMIPNDSLARHGNHTTNLVRDDDEKLYSYRKCSNKFTSYKSPAIRRIRKSKYWKQVSKNSGHYRAG